MTADEVEDYLRAALEAESVDDSSDEMSALRAEHEAVAAAVRAGIEDADPHLAIAGSIAKRTVVRASFDLDIVCYFDHEDDDGGDSLADIYENVKAALAVKYVVEPRRSALRLLSRQHGAERMPFSVDVVPGRFVSDERGDVFLHQEGGDKERLKTNLDVHVAHVRDSGHTDVVRLLKVWKLRSALNIKTFVLELVALAVLADHGVTSLGGRLEFVWTQLRDHADDIQIEDPANRTGNDLAVVFGDAERNTLAGAASIALDLVAAGKWSDVLGIDPGKPEEQPESTALVVMKDFGHQKPPPWRVVPAPGPVHIRCFVHEPRNRGRFELTSGHGLVLSGRDLEYRASTDVPKPFQVRWQVVNTGEHARLDDGLRGDKFFAALKRGRTESSSDALVTWETSKYTGAHWIECFILKDDVLVARGRFDINVVNRDHRGYRPPPPRRRPWRW